MRDEEKRNTRRMVADVLLLICVIFGVLLFSRIRSKNRQMDEISAYTQALAERTALHVADVFQAKQDAITNMAYLYGISLSSDQVDQERLREMEQNPGFDRIRYVNKLGESFTSDRKIADVSDRDYFSRGISGESGVTFVPDSRFDGASLVGFFAPVHFGGDICGVMVGYLEQSSMAELLASDFGGYTANTMLLSADGRILGQAMELDKGESDVTTVDQIIGHSSNPHLTWEALEAHKEARIDLTGSKGSSVACIVPLKGTDWSLMQAFPPQAAARSLNELARHEQLTMGVFLLAVFLFCVRLYGYMHRKSILEREQADADRIAELLGNIADDYLCLVDVNLLTEQEEQFRLRGGEDLPDWSGGSRDYKTCIEGYASEVVSPKDQAFFREATKLENLKEFFSFHKDFHLEYDAVVGDRKLRLQSKFTMCTDQFPEPHILVGIRDITAVTKERLRSETTLNLIVSAASTVYPVIIEENLTKNRAFTVYNQGIVMCGRVEKYTVDEMLSGLQATMPDEGEYKHFCEEMSRDAMLEAHSQGCQGKTLKLRQYGDDGAIHWMEVRNILMKNSVGEVCAILMVRCIDDDIRLTEDLRRAKDAAESASRAKSTFLFNMSHDIRTPMNAIMGFSDMAKRHMEDREKVADCLEKISISGGQLLRLINNVLDMARIESGRVELQERAHRISDSMQAMACVFQADAEKKGLDLRFTTHVREDVAVFDELRLNQIQLNLISNAIKYTPAGGTVTVTLEETGSDKNVISYRLTVEDTGVGMSREFLGSVFEAFERERNAIAGGIEGTGLGLAITKRLIEQMGGSISCESVQGQGSKYTCLFHFRRGEAQSLPENQPEPAAPHSQKQKKILLVEDNALNREISRELLQNDGFQVEEANDGDAALEKIRNSNPGDFDLILMDIQMPKMNGYEATRRIRALDNEALAGIPIIALTANAFEEDRREAFAAGMNGHVAKPIDPAALRKEIGRFL